MSKIDPNKLLITSAFYTVQGEGISSGIPSYFIRLGICNLSCGMSKKWFNDFVKNNVDLPEEEKIPDGTIFQGDLHQQGLATWTCDSTTQWAIRGEDKDFQYIIDRWKEQGVYDDIKSGLVHVIWTGGEPTIKGHQEAIVNFHHYLHDVVYYETLENLKGTAVADEDVYNYIKLDLFNEIETNGTNYIDALLFELLDQINCSPKLSNSGMSAKQRINPEAIKRIMEHPNYQFKFVISNEEDVLELFRDFVVPFNIPLKNVVVMPGMDSREDFHERTQFCLEMAKKYRFRGMTRLHIAAWNRVINV